MGSKRLRCTDEMPTIETEGEKFGERRIRAGGGFVKAGNRTDSL